MKRTMKFLLGILAGAAWVTFSVLLLISPVFDVVALQDYYPGFHWWTVPFFLVDCLVTMAIFGSIQQAIFGPKPKRAEEKSGDQMHADW